MVDLQTNRRGGQSKRRPFSHRAPRARRGQNNHPRAIRLLQRRVDFLYNGYDGEDSMQQAHALEAAFSQRPQSHGRRRLSRADDRHGPRPGQRFVTDNQEGSTRRRTL